jgi:hypothetical protein
VVESSAPDLKIKGLIPANAGTGREKIARKRGQALPSSKSIPRIGIIIAQLLQLKPLIGSNQDNGNDILESHIFKTTI